MGAWGSAQADVSHLTHHRPLLAVVGDGPDVRADPLVTLATQVVQSLTTPGWAHLQDLRPRGRPDRPVEHVLVGPPGVFVIDATSWRGPVSMRHGLVVESGLAWRDAVQDITEATFAVCVYLSASLRRFAVPVLCFVGVEPVLARVGHVQVCTAGAIRGLLEQRRPVLTASQICEVVASLRPIRA